MELTPRTGRIVHYFDHHGPQEPQAAIVTRVDGDKISLVLFSSSTGDPAYQRRTGVPHSETPSVGHWSWPERV